MATKSTAYKIFKLMLLKDPTITGKQANAIYQNIKRGLEYV